MIVPSPLPNGFQGVFGIPTNLVDLYEIVNLCQR